MITPPERISRTLRQVSPAVFRAGLVLVLVLAVGSGPDAAAPPATTLAEMERSIYLFEAEQAAAGWRAFGGVGVGQY